MNKVLKTLLLSFAVAFCCVNGVVWAEPADGSSSSTSSSAKDSTSSSSSSGAKKSSSSGNCEHSLLGLRPWYADLDMEKGSCTIISPSEEDLPAFVWKIVLNVLTDAFMVAGYVAIGFIIFGGYKYLMSGGEPGKVAQGKRTITNAVVGLIISMMATLITNLAIMILNGATK